MQLTITGRQTEIGEALRDHVAVALGAILEKYFKTAVEAHVVLAPEAHLIRTEITLHIGRGIVVNAGAAAPDGGAAFDAAAERIAKQLRRQKRRLRAHHARTRENAEIGGGAGDDLAESVAETAVERPNPSCSDAAIGRGGAAALLRLFRA